MFNDLLSLFYPHYCVICSQNLLTHEKHLCDSCFFRLPRTYFERQSENPVKRLFYGRVELEEAMALYDFQAKSKIQKLIHNFKYKGEDRLAIHMGLELGKAIARTSRYQDINCIVPIPLHPKKLKKRGFNQAQKLGLGISQIIQKPMLDEALKRVQMTSTQTNKSVYERWENVKGIFKVSKGGFLENKHVLLVDDVITTGSTIESCANSILQLPKTKVSVASLAWAQH